MRGARRSGRCVHRSGPSGRSRDALCKHACWGTMPRASCACLCHQNATTDRFGTKSHAQGRGIGTARQLQVGSALPECTVRQAATTSRVPCPANIALCSNDMLSHKVGHLRKGSIICATWPFGSNKASVQNVCLLLSETQVFKDGKGSAPDTPFSLVSPSGAQLYTT